MIEPMCGISRTVSAQNHGNDKEARMGKVYTVEEE